MTKLNQIIAIEKGVKSRVVSEIDLLDKAIQKPDLFNGFSKEYKKRDEDGDDLPSEKKRVQYNVEQVLRSVARLSSELFEVAARRDWTNMLACANVSIDGKVLIEAAPVSYLLFLEKQIIDLRTFVGRLPVLDETEAWVKDANSGLYRTEATQTHRTKKTQKAIVLYPATPEHPAQTQLIAEDVIAGFWHQTKQSGAIPKVERSALLERIEKLLRAVKEAREEANGIDENEPPDVGAIVFGYLLGD
jgi:hypothetical protein